MKTLKPLITFFCAVILSSLCSNVFADYTVEDRASGHSTQKGVLAGPTQFTGTVTGITDDNHITIVRADGKNVPLDCLLWGVDVPTTTEAKKTLEKLILKKKVKVSWQDKQLKQKRTGSFHSKYAKYYLMQITANIEGRQADVGNEMLKLGYGHHVPAETAKSMDNGKYTAAEKHAKQEKIGMWAEGTADDVETE